MEEDAVQNAQIHNTYWSFKAKVTRGAFSELQLLKCRVEASLFLLIWGWEVHTAWGESASYSAAEVKIGH